MPSTTTEAAARPAADLFVDSDDETLLEFIIVALEAAVARAEQHADVIASPSASAGEFRDALAFANRLREVLPVWGHGRLRDVFQDGCDVTDRIRGGE